MPYNLLSINRVNAIMQGLRDVREIPQDLIHLNRTALIDATDEEITADFTGNITIADIIPDGQKAVTRAMGAFALQQVKLPNVKHGTSIDQAMLNLIERIQNAGAIRDEAGIIDRFMERTSDNLLTGVRQTQELMRVGMALDTLTWDRLGVKFTATFGTPSDLKVTVGTTWATAATATPVADIQTQAALRREKYGEPTDRITMTSVAFRQMIATAEFRDKAAVYNTLPGLTAANFPVADMPVMQTIAGRILNMDIELYDAKYFTMNNAGTLSSATNYLPDAKVILGAKVYDNNGAAADIANAIVTESIVAELTGTNFAGPAGQGFGGPQFGPISYVTLATPDLNPPGVVHWAVARCFPRKFRKSMESVLTVG